MVVFLERMEFQDQGTAKPHIHFLLWTNEPPIVIDETATIPCDVFVLLEPILEHIRSQTSMDVHLMNTMDYAQLDPVDPVLISPSQDNPSPSG